MKLLFIDDAAASLQALVRGFRVRKHTAKAVKTGAVTHDPRKSVTATKSISKISNQELKKRLKDEKRDLKQKLKDYDKSFAQDHGRLVLVIVLRIDAFKLFLVSFVANEK
jgi:hypothetical protein